MNPSKKEQAGLFTFRENFSNVKRGKELSSSTTRRATSEKGQERSGKRESKKEKETQKIVDRTMSTRKIGGTKRLENRKT